MTDTGTAPKKIDVGKIAEQTIGEIGRNFPVFLVMSLLLVGVPSLLSSYGQIASNPRLYPAMASPLGLPFAVVGSLLLMVGIYVLQGALVYATVTDLNNRRPSVADCLSVGLRHFFPLLGLAILMVLGLFLGFLAVIVPGVMLATAWAVAVPAQVVENVGITKAFGRSLALTRGNRWRIFGLFMIYFAVSIAVNLVLGVVGGGFRAFLPLAVVLITPVVNVLNSMVGAAGGAVLYFELRRIREGVGAESLASVFD